MKRRTMRHPMIAKAGAIASAVMLGSCLAVGAAFADDASDILSTLPDLLQPGLNTDYVASDSDASLMAKYPNAFDLRHYGASFTYNAEKGMNVFTEEGTNYVTPVKLQNPFGSCWAFACTAASETSMLTSLDKEDGDGETLDGSVDYAKAASGEAGKLAQKASDLSERHLAYFVFSHPSTYGVFSSQAGEGTYLTNGSSDTATMLDTGGMLYLGMSLYSSGKGPVAESVAPYISDEGWIQVPSLQASSAAGMVYKYFLSYKEAKAYMDETWTDEAIATFNKKNDTHLTAFSVMPRVAKIGTWAVDQDKAYGVVAELDTSNIIAATKNEDGSLTDDEMAQMKRELLEGHPLSVAFTADQSRPSDTINSANSYMNTATWAQYTYDKLQVNHAVTIVGYDDDYDASNFTHYVYKQDESGKWVIDEANTALTTPAGDGAWIVKNSWGTTDQKDPLQQMNWGVDGSGYFYLSYYDMNISLMESFEYDLSEEAQERESYDAYQYDLANVTSDISYGVDDEFHMVNVFDGPEAGEKSISVRDLGCVTGSPNATTTLAIYVMDDDADVTKVIDAYQPIEMITETFDSAGFHRMHLDLGAVVEPGQKFAVVQTVERDNGTGQYEYTFNAGMSEEFVNAYNEAVSPIAENAIGHYCITVVNKGESLAKVGDTWEDWTELIPSAEQDQTAKQITNVRLQAAKMKMRAATMPDGPSKVALLAVVANLEAFNVSSSIAIDNWSIKAYADDVEPEYQVGDVNDDDSIDVMDAQIAVDMSNGVWTDSSSYDKLIAALNNDWDYALLYKVADVNAQDGVTACDARAIQSHVHSGSFK